MNPGDLTGADEAAMAADGGATPVATDRFLVAMAAGQRIALPLLDTREIVTARAVTRLPGAPSWIAGLVNVRGAVLTVVDLPSRLGAMPSHGPVVLVEVAERRFGVRVEAVLGVMRAVAEVEPVDDARSAQGVLSGVVSLADAPALVVDLAALQRAAIAAA